MYQHSPFREHTEPMQLEDFPRGVFIRPLTCVDQERRAGGRGIKARENARLEGQRVGPSIMFHDANRKIVIENRLVRIVMANRRDTARQISQAAPQQAQPLGNLQMLADRRLVRMIDVPRPLRCVRILTPAQTRKQRELEMIVRVDQSGQNLQPVKIQLDSLDGTLHVFTHRATKIAGCRAASSNTESFPARANTARSGAPNLRSTRKSGSSLAVTRSLRA